MPEAARPLRCGVGLGLLSVSARGHPGRVGTSGTWAPGLLPKEPQASEVTEECNFSEQVYSGLL